ncbi:TPA: AAA family ATPase [Candidatus Woesearchaeota archaeon]|nr:AAA family ATPase [Candidatus Woesearchaeota archaeon]
MKAVVLAAGVPHKLSGNIPISLCEVRGKKIIDYQLEALEQCGIKDVLVVVGYKAAAIREYLGSRVEYAENTEYETTGSAFSLWLAREHLPEDFVYINGDLIFELEVLKRVLESKYENAFGFDRKYDFTSDMQKMVMIGERIVHHDKRISDDLAHGEAVGPVKVSVTLAQEMFKVIESRIAQGNRKEWVYSILNEITKYLPIYGVNITGLKWGEIDTAEDLRKAELVFGPRKPFMILMFGNPATGKTHTSRALQEHCSAFHRTALLSTFNIREELGLVDLYSNEEREAIYEEMMNRVHSVMKWGTSNVILDGNFNKFNRRKAIYDMAAQYGYQIFVVHCDVSNEQIIQQRLEQRKKMPKSLEHAAATMDLYYLIKQTTEPLEQDLKNGVLANVVKVNSELETVSLGSIAEQDVSYNLEMIQNGIKFGFGKI